MSIAGALAPNAPRFDNQARHYDALLLLSFGGPEGPDDVIPFLENVTRGRGVPSERLAEVAEHYQHFGGVSPINAQNRALIAALERELVAHGLELPIYFGNRNWHPFLTDTLTQMERDGVRDVLVFATSAFSSYSGCRQYREDVLRAVETTSASQMRFDKIRTFGNHPGFISAMSARVREALENVAPEHRADVAVVFTAHSIPLSMARGCAYERQLQDAAALVVAEVGVRDWTLAYQSRSGPPQAPWLEPDILETLDDLAARDVRQVVIAPIGFLSDHMEILFDLDLEAAERAQTLGMTMHRAATVGIHPDFVRAIRQLIEERLQANPERPALGKRGPGHDICPINCCLRGEGRPTPGSSTAAAGVAR